MNTANAQRLRRIRAYINAVGNLAQRHYQESFVDSGFGLPGGSGFIAFKEQPARVTLAMACRVVPPRAPSAATRCNVGNGGTVVFYLEWNDSFAAPATTITFTSLTIHRFPSRRQYEPADRLTAPDRVSRLDNNSGQNDSSVT